jgi:hypothetical protein
LLELLFQLPPRITRSPNFLSPHPTGAYMREKISRRNPPTLGVRGMPNPGPHRLANFCKRHASVPRKPKFSSQTSLKLSRRRSSKRMKSST